MAIASLVVRSGIGSWGDIAHIITRGLDVGAVAAVWTPVATVSGTWTGASAATGTWTPASTPSGTWTGQ